MQDGEGGEDLRHVEEVAYKYHVVPRVMEQEPGIAPVNGVNCNRDQVRNEVCAEEEEESASNVLVVVQLALLESAVHHAHQTTEHKQLDHHVEEAEAQGDVGVDSRLHNEAGAADKHSQQEEFARHL